MKIEYSTGVKTYEVAGGEISFNPTDTEFSRRLYDCFEKLANLQTEGEVKNAEVEQDGRKLYDMIGEREAEMRKNIENVFGEGSASKIFPDTGLYALADGLPVWANFLLAIVDIVEEASDKEIGIATPRADMLMKKYGKYIKK